MAKYVVAVSGGVDSVVLLDILTRAGNHELIVAHFDHGIRTDSHKDAKFVAELAERYGLPFESKREILGEGASEAYARQRRYAFLRALAEKHDAKIVTAHHGDDAVETVAINLHRGTGWRGVAVLDSDIVRPLLNHRKKSLYAYAAQQGLTWREDSTNSSDKYLRNRLRRRAAELAHDEVSQVLALRSQQLAIKEAIEDEVARVIGDGPEYSRYFFTHIPQNVALECLRYLTKARLTRPQMERALLAIKTAPAGTKREAGAGITLEFTTRNFSL